MRRTAMVSVAASVLALSACGPALSGGGAAAEPHTPAAVETTPAAMPQPTPPPDEPRGPFDLAINVADGATNVPVDTLLTITPAFGKVTDVKVATTASGRSTVPDITGAVNDQGAWTAGTRLDPGATYTVTADGEGSDGTTKTQTARFTTQSLSRSQEVYPTLTPVLDGPFGVAQPVVIQFDHPVADKAEFEKNLHVTSVPAQEGSWGWMDDETIHWRPKDYWQPGTQVTLDANLNGVNAGNGLYGQENRTLSFTIGRKQIGKVDIAAHTLTWEVENQSPKTYPMTAGKPGFTTRSGTKVVMDKAANVQMNSETTGIDRDSSEGYSVKAAYALRVTTSGEFIHSAPWSAGNFGKRNASHGCVGMDSEQMYALYETAQIGDPVVFTGSDRKLEFGNGWSEWDLTYDEWKAKSALQ